MDQLLQALNSDAWPKAVEPFLICDETSESDRRERADAILDMLVENLKGKKFLDYGCGYGDCVAAAKDKGASLVVGYEVKHYNDVPLTDWSKIQENSPYDVILIYDVLDHAVGESPVEILKKIKTVLTKKGAIYVTCHPWCSKHATHLYRKINKSFIHLVFSEEQLKEMGYEGEPTIKVLHPIVTYSNWFSEAGLVINQQSVKRDLVNGFFKQGEIAEKIKSNWINHSHEVGLNLGKNFPSYQLEQEFHNYVLTK